MGIMTPDGTQTVSASIARPPGQIETDAVEAHAASLIRVDTRIPPLDGLRGMASLMVVGYHFGPHIVRDAGSDFVFLRSLPPLWFHGVDLFFVLSGFLISGILVSVRGSSQYFSTFYIRRAFRIFPAYYAVFFSYALVVILLGARTGSLGRLFENPLPLWSYGFYVQNVAMATASTFGPIWMAGSWSLAVEEQFYVTLPALIRRVGDRGLFCLAGFSLIGAPVLRALIQKFRFVPELSNVVLLPTRVDSLAVGVLVMILLRHRTQWLEENKQGVILSVLALFLGWTVYPYVPNPQHVRLAFIEPTVTAVTFGSILVGVLISPRGFCGKFLSTSGMRLFGNMAYSTYLLHPIALCAVFQIWAGRDPSLNDPLDLALVGVAGIVTAALSWLSWSHFERPLVRVGHTFRY